MWYANVVTRDWAATLDLPRDIEIKYVVQSTPAITDDQNLEVFRPL